MSISPLSASPTVAILGASGIGRNHARWFWKHGARVESFLGSSPESVARTGSLLSAAFPFDGRGYDDLGELLRTERPQIVCISTPPAQHEDQIGAALESGAHVLCEKPLIFEENRGSKYLQGRAEDLVAMAHERNLLLGTQMQYASAAHDLARASGHAGTMRSFAMEMETKNVKEREGAQVWLDLSPHPISVLQVLAGAGADLDASGIRCRVEKRQSHAEFAIVKASGERIEASITVRFDPEASPPLRCFRFNESTVELSGHRDSDGEFRALLTNSRGEKIVRADFVDTLIGDFLAATRGERELVVTGEMGAQNVAWQHAILEAS